ncbi:MAG: hypothetical protein ABF990_11855 [Acetobacter sp.]|uniref:hypothetical protein n=1 Tax=Acetobacter sp. TaxID=440 RepID=UPI0039E7EB4D
MSLYRSQLRDKVAGLLQQTTDARDSVFTVAAYPLPSEKLPAIFVTVPSEQAESNSRGTPDYTRTALLEVTAKVCGGNPAMVQGVLDRIAEQIEMSVMCSADIMSMVQQVSSIDTEQQMTADSAEYLGAVRLTFAMEYTQEYPVSGVPFTQITGDLTGTIAAGFVADLPQE